MRFIAHAQEVIFKTAPWGNHLVDGATYNRISSPTIVPVFTKKATAILRPFSREIVRKLLHLPVFLFPLIALYSTPAAIAVLVVLALAYLAAIVAERHGGSTIPVLSPIIAYCKRDTHYDLGPLYLAVGMAIALAFAGPRQAFFAAYVIGISDSAASLAGMRFGTRTIPFVNKSYVGSLVFFATCFLGALYFLSPLNALIAAGILMLVELVSIHGLDNLTLPIAAQLLLMVFS